MSYKFQNWSGSVVSKNREIYYPSSEQEIQIIIQRAIKENKKVRVIGSGHSFSELLQDSDVYLSLDKMTGIISIDKEKQRATLWAGTKLQKANEILYALGFALINLGDIDKQSIAGVTSTGTHGTGIAFGNISTQVTAIRIINGQGEIVDISAENHPDIFSGSVIALGALGVVTQITFQLVPAYKLEYHADKEAVNAVLENYPTYNRDNRNFEFYYFPYADTVQTKFSNESKAPAKAPNVFNYVSDFFLENYAWQLLCSSSRLSPSLSKPISRFAARIASKTAPKLNWSHRVFAMPRLVRFNEMEYAVPVETFKDVFQETIRQYEKHQFQTVFPWEIRFAKKDALWLSTAYERDIAYIAFHEYKGKPYHKFFEIMEAICVEAKGRPHWGKMHTRTAQDFEILYPRWNDFLSLRDTMDPQKVFVTSYMQKILGV